MYAPTAGAARWARPVRARAKITSTRPAVATTSASRCGQVARSVVLHETAGAANMRFARTAPVMHPTIWAGMYRAIVEPACGAEERVDDGHDGVEVGAATVAEIRIRTASPSAVAMAFSRSCSPMSVGESCWAAMPEPMTTAVSSALPRNSPAMRRDALGVISRR